MKGKFFSVNSQPLLVCTGRERGRGGGENTKPFLGKLSIATSNLLYQQMLLREREREPARTRICSDFLLRARVVRVQQSEATPERDRITDNKLDVHANVVRQYTR